MKTGNFLRTLFMLELIILASLVFQEETEMQTSMFGKDRYEKNPSQTCFLPFLLPPRNHPLFNHILTYRCQY